MPYCLATVKPFASSACAQISAMILDSGKSAEPTTIDLRSPEADPPPRGLELPHAAAIRAIAAATTARTDLRVLDIPNVLPAHWIVRTLATCAPERLPLRQRE